MRRNYNQNGAQSEENTWSAGEGQIAAYLVGEGGAARSWKPSVAGELTPDEESQRADGDGVTPSKTVSIYALALAAWTGSPSRGGRSRPLRAAGCPAPTSLTSTPPAACSPSVASSASDRQGGVWRTFSAASRHREAWRRVGGMAGASAAGWVNWKEREGKPKKNGANFLRWHPT
jgi:hypothetical protein